MIEFIYTHCERDCVHAIVTYMGKYWGEVFLRIDKCLPCGLYSLDYYNSPKHTRRVPRFTKYTPDKPPYLQQDISEHYIEIHWGNSIKDTAGCVLTGTPTYHNGNYWCMQSKAEFERLTKDINFAEDHKVRVYCAPYFKRDVNLRFWKL